MSELVHLPDFGDPRSLWVIEMWDPDTGQWASTIAVCRDSRDAENELHRWSKTLPGHKLRLCLYVADK
jgi:hypothetical protein